MLTVVYNTKAAASGRIVRQKVPVDWKNRGGFTRPSPREVVVLLCIVISTVSAAFTAEVSGPWC